MTSSLFNQAAETGYLAGLLRYPDKYEELNEVGVSASDFTSPTNKRVANAIFDIVSEHNIPDFVNVTEALMKNGREEDLTFVESLRTAPVTLEQTTSYGRLVKKLAVTRSIGDLGANIISVAQEGRDDYEGASIEVGELVNKFLNQLPERPQSPNPASIIESLKEMQEEKTTPIGWSHTLQDITGGYRPKQLWVLGGYSSVGKSAVACNIALHTLKAHDNRVMIVSAEMSQQDYIIRMLSMLSQIPAKQIRDNVTIGFREHERLAKAKERLSASKLLVYEDLYTLKSIRNEARKVKSRGGLDMLIVDFHQNITVTGDEVSDAREVAIGLQRLAKELEIVIVDFSQLSNAQANQDNEEKGLGETYAFKGSGAIKDAADVAILLRREKFKGGDIARKLHIHVKKNRHGEVPPAFIVNMDLPTGTIREPLDSALEV